MPRYIPPHLMALVIFLIIILWVMLVHQFRRSTAMQRFVAEALGDDTPENTIRAFEAAKRRLESHLSDRTLDIQMRQQIELALGVPQADAVDDRQADMAQADRNHMPVQVAK